jgi:hypothetical protein
LEVILAGEHPEVALAGADAAVALCRALDLGDLDLVDEGGAVAVSAVVLEFGHLVLRI